jgi:hypothetical protein
MFFPILFVLLESTQFKAPEGSKNGKQIRMELTGSYPGPFVCVSHLLHMSASFVVSNSVILI